MKTTANYWRACLQKQGSRFQPFTPGWLVTALADEGRYCDTVLGTPFKTLGAVSCLPCSESPGEPHCSEAAAG